MTDAAQRTMLRAARQSGDLPALVRWLRAREREGIAHSLAVAGLRLLNEPAACELKANDWATFTGSELGRQVQHLLDHVVKPPLVISHAWARAWATATCCGLLYRNFMKAHEEYSTHRLQVTGEQVPCRVCLAMTPWANEVERWVNDPEWSNSEGALAELSWATTAAKAERQWTGMVLREAMAVNQDAGARITEGFANADMASAPVRRAASHELATELRGLCWAKLEGAPYVFKLNKETTKA